MVRNLLETLLPGADDDALEYFVSLIMDTEDPSNIKEVLAPFIESYGFSPSLEEAELKCEEICNNLGLSKSTGNSRDDSVQVLDKAFQLGTSLLSKEEQQDCETLWGFDQIRQKRNETIEMTEAGSARYEREAKKEQVELFMA